LCLGALRLYKRLEVCCLLVLCWYAESDGNFKGLIMKEQAPICPGCRKNKCYWNETYKDWAICFDCAEKIQRANERGDFDLHKTELRIASGIPKRFSEAMLRDFPKAIQGLFTPNQGLHVYGKVGTGKTHLACAIANQFIMHRKEVFFFNVPKLLEDIRQEYNTNPLRSLFTKAGHAERIILDDLGTEKSSEWAVEQLYLIIDYRYSNNLYTTITTNRKDTELESRIARRSLDMNIKLELC